MQAGGQEFESPRHEEFLKEPLGHKSHQLLHTHYINRKN
ncbi:iron hydrogenase small subunit [Caloranaerobacter sp. DY30410]